MSTTQTTLPPLNTIASNLSKGDYFWATLVQQQHPLVLVNTASGNFSEAVPAAGNNPATGQTAQNQEITFKKISADAHTFTLTGVEDGPLTLTAQYSFFKIKSDGTSWWRSG